MKTETLVVDVTSVGAPDRAKRVIFGMIYRDFWPIQAMFVVGRGALCDGGTPS